MEPNGTVRRRFWIRWGLAFGVTALLVFLAALPPFVPLPFRHLLMEAFGPVCHQLPARSPSVEGLPFAVCHRCFGIYAGLPLAALGFLLHRGIGDYVNRNARVLIVLSLAPMAVDWGVDYLGLWANTATSRLLTGGVFGLAAGLFLTRAIVAPPPEEAEGVREAGPVRAEAERV